MCKKMNQGEQPKARYKYKPVMQEVLGQGIKPLWAERDMGELHGEFEVVDEEAFKEKVEELLKHGVKVLREDKGHKGYVEIRLRYVEPPSKVINPIKAVKRLHVPNSFRAIDIPTISEKIRAGFFEAVKSAEENGRVCMIYEHWFYGPADIIDVAVEQSWEYFKVGYKLLKSREQALEIAKECKLEIRTI